MRLTRVLLLAGVLPLAACTSFADSAPTASSAGASSAGASSAGASSSTPASSSPGSTDLTVTDETDLGVAATTVTAARVVVAADGTPQTLVVGAQTSTVRTGGSTTSLTGTQVTDLVSAARGPVGVTLTADPVSPDPLLGVVPLGGTGVQGGTPFSPEQTAPRGLPVYAAAGPDGDVLYVLAESTDGVGATVYALDPSTGALQDSADVDTGFSDVTALTLGGLAVTGDGDLVIGLGLDSGDELARGGTAAPLLRLDPDLRPSGQPVDTQSGTGRGEVLAVTTDDDGDPVALVSDGDAGLQVVDADLDAGTSTTVPLDVEDARAGGVATAGGTTVVTLLDQSAPTVLVDGDPLELCAGSGDALAVTATDDGFLVVGTCDDTTRLWTLT